METVVWRTRARDPRRAVARSASRRCQDFAAVPEVVGATRETSCRLAVKVSSFGQSRQRMVNDSPVLSIATTTASHHAGWSPSSWYSTTLPTFMSAQEWGVAAFTVDG